MVLSEDNSILLYFCCPRLVLVNPESLKNLKWISLRVPPQAVPAAEWLPRAFFRGWFHRRPLLSGCHLSDIWAHPALLPLPPHREEVHWVLWEPHEDSEERLQVSVTPGNFISEGFFFFPSRLRLLMFRQAAGVPPSYEELLPVGSRRHHVWLLHSHLWQGAGEGELAAAVFSQRSASGGSWTAPPRGQQQVLHAFISTFTYFQQEKQQVTPPMIPHYFIHVIKLWLVLWSWLTDPEQEKLNTVHWRWVMITIRILLVILLRSHFVLPSFFFIS